MTFLWAPGVSEGSGSIWSVGWQEGLLVVRSQMISLWICTAFWLKPSCAKRGIARAMVREKLRISRSRDLNTYIAPSPEAMALARRPFT